MKFRLSDDLGCEVEFAATEKTFRARLARSLDTYATAKRPTSSARLYLQTPDGRWITPWYPYTSMSVPVDRFLSPEAAERLYRLATQAIRAAGHYTLERAAGAAPEAAGGPQGPAPARSGTMH